MGSAGRPLLYAVGSNRCAWTAVGPSRLPAPFEGGFVNLAAELLVARSPGASLLLQTPETATAGRCWRQAGSVPEATFLPLYHCGSEFPYHIAQNLRLTAFTPKNGISPMKMNFIIVAGLGPSPFLWCCWVLISKGVGQIFTLFFFLSFSRGAA